MDHLEPWDACDPLELWDPCRPWVATSLTPLDDVVVAVAVASVTAGGGIGKATGSGWRTPPPPKEIRPSVNLGMDRMETDMRSLRVPLVEQEEVEGITEVGTIFVVGCQAELRGKLGRRERGSRG